MSPISRDAWAVHANFATGLRYARGPFAVEIDTAHCHLLAADGSGPEDKQGSPS